MTTMMKAWQFERYGRYDEVLEWVDRPQPEPGPNQALVRTRAVSLNFPDLLITQGLYQARAPLPAVSGVEGVGVVEAVGPGSPFAVGQRVVSFNNLAGMLADCFIAHNATSWAVPDHVSDAQAAALSTTYGTSYYALVHRARIQPGETLLVAGAAGGVGLAAVQLGKVFGARVIAAAGSAEKLAVCRDNGADELINYQEEDIVERVKDLTDGRGADVIYDPVGGDLFDQMKRCIAWEGRMLVIGFAAGRIPTIECNRMLLKNMAVVGLAWGPCVERNPAQGAACQQHLYDLLRVGAIDPVIYRTLPFADVREGMRLMESRALYGKIVITR
ncbi:MAG: NADPH:quinone oxidoreductase family protein [Gammaproteobacteria bacterium]